MSSIVTPQGIVHYEAYGRGKPVILLHGWINSWGVWQDSMVEIAEKGRYKVYALDFWGFGESAKSSTLPFKVSSYVQMVDQFMETLGILAAPVFGHSMGGTVALSLALERPDKVPRVAVVGSPIDGRSLHFFLKLGGVRWIARLLWRAPFILEFVIRLVLIYDSDRTRKMILHDVSKTSTESFFRSIGDLHHTDLRPRLGHVRVPTLGIFGLRDIIVDPRQSRVLAEGVPHARVEMFQRSGHFPMLDEPELFHGILLDFLKSPG